MYGRNAYTRLFLLPTTPIQNNSWTSAFQRPPLSFPAPESIPKRFFSTEQTILPIANIRWSSCQYVGDPMMKYFPKSTSSTVDIKPLIMYTDFTRFCQTSASVCFSPNCTATNRLSHYKIFTFLCSRTSTNPHTKLEAGLLHSLE